MKQPLASKERASRIPLDYHRRYDRLEWWKFLLTGAAALAATAWLWAGALRPDGGRTWVAPAPVSHAHALWDANCQACHTDFVPIRGDAAGAHWFDTATAAERFDAKCLACHAAPAHNDRVLAADALACASCHHEHRGREASLTRVADAACTGCHAQIAAHRTATDDDAAATTVAVARFDAQRHPEFRSLAHDPGTIRFTHAQHLTPGQPKYDPASGEPGRPLWRLADLSPADRERYRRPGQSDDDFVSLTCGDCHQPAAAHGATRGGAYMRPIAFDRDCRACHALSTQPGGADVVPHGLAARELVRFLADTLLREALEATSADESEEAPPAAPAARRSPVPGEPTLERLAAARPIVEQRLAASERHLATAVCRKCHAMQSGAAGVAVEPAQLPGVWLKHARFDHAAHRGVSCRECHEGAYPDSPHASHAASDVLIAGRDNCLQCHAPTSAVGLGGARFDCAQCHTYHGREAWRALLDRPPPDAAEWHAMVTGDRFDPSAAAAPRGLSLREFLQGAAQPPSEMAP